MLLRIIIISERALVCRGGNRGVAFRQQVGGGVKSSSSVWVNTQPHIISKNFKIADIKIARSQLSAERIRLVRLN